MKTNLVTSIAIVSSIGVTPVLAQKSVSQMTQSEIHDELIALCKDPDVNNNLARPDEICEISTDDGKTWISIGSLALSAGLLAGFAGVGILMRRRTKNASGNTSEKQFAKPKTPSQYTQGNIPVISTATISSISHNIPNQQIPQLVSPDQIRIHEQIRHIREILDHDSVSPDAESGLRRILRSGTRFLTNKEKIPLRVSLMQIYYKRMDKKSYKEEFEIMRGLTPISERRHNDELLQSAQLGIELDSEESSYQEIIWWYDRHCKKVVYQDTQPMQSTPEDNFLDVPSVEHPILTDKKTDSSPSRSTIYDNPNIPEHIMRLFGVLEEHYSGDELERVKKIISDSFKNQNQTSTNTNAVAEGLYVKYFQNNNGADYETMLKIDPNTERYLESLYDILSQYGPEQLEQKKDKIREEFDDYMESILHHIQLDSIIRQDAWIYREIAKQYNIAKNQSNPDKDPMIREQVLRDIAMGCIGRIIVKQDPGHPVLKNPEIIELMRQNPKTLISFYPAEAYIRIGYEVFINFRDSLGDGDI